ncbi:hypothetical protein ccbrp13_11630 [Ktedonobacteria bacterium brp13]|nr:hypothetical protein ccbrp13_11630 [Ktedonobacteria bacterium brp13]
MPRMDNDPLLGLLGKSGLITREIARDLITVRPNERIKGTEEYAQQFRAGFGTVQKALDTLEETHAIKLESRGHRGTFIVSSDLSLLWALSGLGIIVGIMPLPNSRELEGIATALAYAFSEAGLPLNLTHLNGGRRRIEQLQSGLANFVVLSLFSANEACAKDPALTRFLTCSPYSYYSRASLVVLTRGDIVDRAAIQRVGIDATSRDHAEITYREFDPSRVEFVQVPYHLIPEMVSRGQIDGAAWHRTTQRIDPTNHSFHFFPLKQASVDEILGDLDSLAVVGHKNDHTLHALFEHYIDPTKLEQVQNDVIEGRRVPLY